MEIPPFWLAVMSDDLKLLKETVTPSNLNAPSPSESYSPLMVAANRSFSDICTFLVDCGADVNLKSDSGMTALMLAMNPSSESDSHKIATLLLKAGAEVNAESGGGNTALMEAAHKGMTTLVELLIEKGASLNTQNKYGETALIVSCMKGGEPLVVKALLKAGADKTLKDVDGLDALQTAEKNECSDIVSILR